MGLRETAAARTVAHAVTAGYAVWAAAYDREANPLVYLVEKELVARWGRSRRPATVVELGCGTGRNLAFWALRGVEDLRGIDASAAMLAVAKRRAALRTVYATLRTSSLEKAPRAWNGKADVVIITLVLEHLADMTPAYETAARLLKPGGTLWIAELHAASWAVGSRARYLNAAGTETPLPSFAHSHGEHAEAGRAAGLELVKRRDVRVTKADVAAMPKLAKRGAVPRLLVVEFKAPKAASRLARGSRGRAPRGAGASKDGTSRRPIRRARAAPRKSQ